MEHVKIEESPGSLLRIGINFRATGFIYQYCHILTHLVTAKNIFIGKCEIQPITQCVPGSLLINRFHWKMHF